MAGIGQAQSPLAAMLMQALPMLLQQAQAGGGAGMGAGGQAPMGGAVPPAMNAGQMQGGGQPPGGPGMGGPPGMGGGMGGPGMGGLGQILQMLLSHPQGMQILHALMGGGMGGQRLPMQPGQRAGAQPAGNALPGSGTAPQGTAAAQPPMGGVQPSNMLPGMMAQPQENPNSVAGMMPTLGTPPPPMPTAGAPGAGALAPSGLNPAVNQIIARMFQGGAPGNTAGAAMV